MKRLFQPGDKPERGPRDRAPRARPAHLPKPPAFIRRTLELFPWTPLGATLTAAAYAALEWIGYAERDLIWLVVGYVGLGLTLICPFLVLAVAAWLRLRGRLPEPDEGLVLETGKLARTGFCVRFPAFVPLVQIAWDFRFPPGLQAQQRRERGLSCEFARTDERGRFESVVRRMRVFDSLGLSRVAMSLPAERRVDVLPGLGGLRHLPALTGFASGDALPHPMGLADGDRLELQRYTPGDPARFIHWKVLGRTRRLMVRMPERALTIARRTAVFFVAGAQDDASAAVARLAIERNLLGGEWVFATDDNPAGASQRDEALVLLMRSSARRDDAGAGLSAFVRHVEREGPASLLLFAPPVSGPWLGPLCELCRRKKPRVVIGVDGIDDSAPRPLWRRLLMLSPAPPRATRAEELDRVTEEIARTGASVLVFDRVSGQALSAAHRAAMRRAAGPAGGAKRESKRARGDGAPTALGGRA